MIARLRSCLWRAILGIGPYKVRGNVAVNTAGGGSPPDSLRRKSGTGDKSRLLPCPSRQASTGARLLGGFTSKRREQYYYTAFFSCASSLRSLPPSRFRRLAGSSAADGDDHQPEENKILRA